jgi:hypothetical protein
MPSKIIADSSRVGGFVFVGLNSARAGAGGCDFKFQIQDKSRES